MTAYGPATALIIVDVQNDFADPDGSLFVSSAPDVLDYINEQARDARAAGSLVIRTQDWHPPSTPHFVTDGGPWPVHCVADSWGAEFHRDLAADGPVVRKGVDGGDGYSGFTVRDPESGAEQPTDMNALLAAHSITDVRICGLATDYCVKETALDAVRLGYATTVLANGIGAVDVEPGDGARAIATMVEAGIAIV